MQNLILLLFIHFAAIQGSFALDNVEAILDSLDHTIEQKQQFENQKEREIEILKQWLLESSSTRETFDLSTRLYNAYKKYQIDSAIVYAEEALKCARELNVSENICHTNFQLVTLYSSAGMFREAEAILKDTDKEEVPKDLLADYFNAYRLFLNYYAANVRTNDYLEKTRAYRDSLMQVLKPASRSYRIYQAEALIEEGKTNNAKEKLQQLLKATTPEDSDYAMITFLMGLAEEADGNTDQSRKYYALSAIGDIRKATKDNSSIHHLAGLEYDRGNIERAFRYAQVALNDALFCNVQFRTYYLTQFFTFINANYKEKIDNQRSQLLLYLFLISLLSLFLIAAVIYVYKQKDKVSRIRSELDEMNKELIRLNNDISKKNNQLNERNTLLQDANQIKEEYIAHFFDLCSSYINKLEDYRKSLNKKAVNGEHEKLFKMLKSTSIIETEVEELYSNFDTIFLNLYPTFVDEFYALLTDEEKPEPRPGEKLNTELRIFALIRLGITDSVKIASFLRYSLSTIYNYRTRARNRAAVPREKFEEMVMKIGPVRNNPEISE
jgi:uncharacterized protein YoxC